MATVDHGAVDLSRAGRVSISDMRILPVVAIDFAPGGMEQPHAIAHMRLIDIPKQTALYVPLQMAFLRGLLTQVQSLLTYLESNTTEGE